MDLDQLEPELREEVNEAFIEVTAFVKNKLLEIIRVSEVGNSEGKFLEKFTFLNVNGSTNILYETRFDISNLHYTVNDSEKKPSKFFKFFASIFINRMLKFGIKTRLKDVKVVIEAEPFDGIS